MNYIISKWMREKIGLEKTACGIFYRPQYNLGRHQQNKTKLNSQNLIVERQLLKTWELKWTRYFGQQIKFIVREDESRCCSFCYKVVEYK